MTFSSYQISLHLLILFLFLFSPFLVPYPLSSELLFQPHVYYTRYFENIHSC